MLIFFLILFFLPVIAHGSTENDENQKENNNLADTTVTLIDGFGIGLDLSLIHYTSKIDNIYDETFEFNSTFILGLGINTYKYLNDDLYYTVGLNLAWQNMGISPYVKTNSIKELKYLEVDTVIITDVFTNQITISVPFEINYNLTNPLYIEYDKYKIPLFPGLLINLGLEPIYAIKTDPLNSTLRDTEKTKYEAPNMPWRINNKKIENASNKYFNESFNDFSMLLSLGLGFYFDTKNSKNLSPQNIYPYPLYYYQQINPKNIAIGFKLKYHIFKPIDYFDKYKFSISIFLRILY